MKIAVIETFRPEVFPNILTIVLPRRVFDDALINK